MSTTLAGVSRADSVASRMGRVSLAGAQVGIGLSQTPHEFFKARGASCSSGHCLSRAASPRLPTMTEVWFRNPHNYVRELVEVGGPYRVVWDRGMLVKKRIEPVAHAILYFGKNADFEILCIGPQGTAHLDADHLLDRPKAVYPTWEYGENLNILEEMVSSPIGLDADACSADLPLDERPVIGQDHRVVITNLPNAQVGANRPFYRNLRELQEEYPDCKILLHGSYSFRVMFGMGFGSADVEPRTDAANGKVFLPNGKTLAYARTVGQLQWVNVLGMSVTDLKIPNKRCIFNIKSAIWAGEHFTENLKFKSQGSTKVDPDSPMTLTPVTKSFRTDPKIVVTEGDMITCNTCSLHNSCKLYREGAVCSVNDSETSALAKMFKSRDSSLIIDGLGTVLAAQTDRLQRGMESEEEFGELDPEVTKMMNSLFGNGIKLAKLVDPTLTKPLVQINGNTAAVAGSSPKELGAAVIRALENQGMKREDITPAMFEGMLLKMTGGPEPQNVEQLG